ncbi:uncharacterized protein LOC131253533 [Magnolia sinica]|uniref:uncharacterized protein LOC131253533 n=1 Tax=Magnolia sinica TaxID=86752 RepID=UPI0026590187|nr:uncharacterized protein LOC131253533 [Magnolia sinica]
MISCRVYAAASHDSLKPLFSRQNFLQLSAFRNMASGKGRGGSNSRGRRSPSSGRSPRSSQSASDDNSMSQKDEPSIPASNIKDNGRCHKGGRQHERMVREESQDSYSSSRCSPSVEDSSNPCESASYEGQKDKPSIATSDVNDNGHSHIGGRQHEQKVEEGSQVRDSISRVRDSLSTQDSPNSDKFGSMSVRIGTSPTSEENNFTEKGMETGFDICPKKTTAPVKLKSSLLLKNKEKRKEQEQMDKGHQIKQLRSGMILLKNYLGHSEQVEIIKECHRLGLGKGGFYQPGYSDGAKLHLQMMCLGKDWDPENKYRSRRFVDDAEPPSIPDGFKTMVKRSLQDSHDFIKQDSKVSSVEDILPNMKPDLCIVNFYTDKGKLGLHQDRDESLDSLHKRLAVVSFSIGDSAEFLYGDDRFADKAEKVLLESGDVLIFGGESRHIFHGISSILPGTAPKLLVEETKLRPGRLNLTFRQY